MKHPSESPPPTYELQEIIDSMNCGVIGRDMEGHVTFVNQRLLSWLGYEREEVVGQVNERLVPPELRDLMTEERKAVDAGDLRVRLVVLQRKDSSTFPALVIPHRDLDDRGEQVGGFAVIIDLAAVQTAKQTLGRGREPVRGLLSRIALELETISLIADLPAFAPLPLHHPELCELSEREREVLALLASGDRVSAIAGQLEISPHTVRNHLKSMFRKLEVSNQQELLQRARSLHEDATAAQGAGI